MRTSPPRDLLVLGGDPGKSGSLALLHLPPAGRPRLAGLWPVSATALDLYWARSAEAGRQAREVAMELGWRLGTDQDPTAYVELIPVGMREGSIPGVRRGLAAWAGLGQRRGLLLAGLFAAGWSVRPIEQGDWARAAGVTQSKQGVDPQVRVREAGVLVEGARDALAALPASTEAAASRVIDAAESILIALGGALIERNARVAAAAAIRGKEG